MRATSCRFKSCFPHLLHHKDLRRLGASPFFMRRAEIREKSVTTGRTQGTCIALRRLDLGLGKTIEAGIVLSQKWAERRRRILLILPAALRSQWQQELEEKFYLPSVILETQTYNRLRREGQANPFDQNKIIICFYHFASARHSWTTSTKTFTPGSRSAARKPIQCFPSGNNGSCRSLGKSWTTRPYSTPRNPGSSTPAPMLASATIISIGGMPRGTRATSTVPTTPWLSG